MTSSSEHQGSRCGPRCQFFYRRRGRTCAAPTVGLRLTAAVPGTGEGWRGWRPVARNRPPNAGDHERLWAAGLLVPSRSLPFGTYRPDTWKRPEPRRASAHLSDHRGRRTVPSSAVLGIAYPEPQTRCASLKSGSAQPRGSFWPSQLASRARTAHSRPLRSQHS